jgi:hypothetical protein
VRPGTDDKILTGWNALMLAALAEAGRYLGRLDYVQAAQKNARFLLDNLVVEGRLMRSWREPSEPHPGPLQKKSAFGEGAREGKARHKAYLEDYAALVLGLLALYQSDANPEWYAAAVRLAEEMIAHFDDAAGGFYDTRDDAEALLFRPKELQDNATPSGGALAACALLQLAAYGELAEWRDQAEQMLAAVLELMARHPTAFAQWLCAADFAQGPVVEVALVGDAAAPQTTSLRDGLWQRYQPRQVTAQSGFPPASGSPPLLLDRPLKDDLPTAYVCRGFVCRQPVNTVQEMLAQLDG